jgi:hypothetical protein
MDVHYELLAHADFFRRVRFCVSRVAVNPKISTILAYQLWGFNLVAMRLIGGYVDIYFDFGLWQPSQAGGFSPQQLFFQRSENIGLLTCEGGGDSPKPITNFEEALLFARSVLEPIPPTQWYDTPIDGKLGIYGLP